MLWQQKVQKPNPSDCQEEQRTSGWNLRWHALTPWNFRGLESKKSGSWGSLGFEMKQKIMNFIAKDIQKRSIAICFERSSFFEAPSGLILSRTVSPLGGHPKVFSMFISYAEGEDLKATEISSCLKATFQHRHLLLVEVLMDDSVVDDTSVPKIQVGQSSTVLCSTTFPKKTPFVLQPSKKLSKKKQSWILTTI